MKEVELVFYHVLHSVAPKDFPKEKRAVIQCSKTTTLKELLVSAEEPCADLSQYYNLSKEYCFNEQFLPYVLGSDGKVRWNVKYDDVTIGDFVRTHDIHDNVIYADTGIPQAGGIGVKQIAELWISYYPILDQFVTAVGAIKGIAVVGKWIKGLFKKDAPPPAIFDLILSRERWNHVELAVITDIGVENAKMLLKTFGFAWDPVSRQYLKGPQSEEIIGKLSTVSVHCD